MEGRSAPVENQSDSDSSESWTFVDNKLPKLQIQDQDASSSSSEEFLEREVKDPEEDTDGVAVITDDEEVSATQDIPTVCEPPPVYQSAQFISLPSSEYGLPNKPIDFDSCSSAPFRDSDEELPSDFFMSNRKIKSYVHKRNNHVSSLLNLVLIGAVIIATTLAVGFTWGINDTCSLDVLDSLNGILINLQKLQKENEMLKSKIKVLRAMKYNKPVEKDVNFDKYLEYQMHLEQEKIIPKFDKSDDLLDNLPDYNIVTQPPLVNKGIMNTISSKVHKDLQANNSNLLVGVVEDKEVNDYKEYNINKLETNSKLQGDVHKNTNNKDNHFKLRLRRETKINLDKHYPSQPSDIKSFCDDASISNDKEYKKKCTLLNKHNNEAKRDKFRLKMEDKYKVNEDMTEKNKKASLDENKKANKDFEKFSLKDKPKPRELKKDKKYRTREAFSSEEFRVPENQAHHNHYNDNVKADWYQKMYDGRKEIRDKGFDDYDLLDIKNKAKWYFKRMNEREKNRWKGGDKFYRRQIRKEYLKSRF